MVDLLLLSFSASEELQEKVEEQGNCTEIQGNGALV